MERCSAIESGASPVTSLYSKHRIVATNGDHGDEWRYGVQNEIFEGERVSEAVRAVWHDGWVYGTQVPTLQRYLGSDIATRGLAGLGSTEGRCPSRCPDRKGSTSAVLELPTSDNVGTLQIVRVKCIVRVKYCENCYEGITA